MLSRDDAALVAREKNIPGLSVLLDSDRFAELLAESPLTAHLANFRPFYLRFKTGTRALAAFTDGASHFYAVAHGPDAAAKTSAEENKSRPLDGPLHLASQALSLFPFPSDRRLQALQRLATQSGRVRLFDRVLPRNPETTRGRLEILAYKPERRFVARLRGDQEVVLKFHNAVGFEGALRRSEALQHCSFPGIPEILGRSCKHRIIAYRWCDGDLLRERIDQGSGASALEATGVALAEFHRVSGELFPLSKRAALPDLHASALSLRAIAPMEHERIDTLEKKLCDALAASDMTPVLCHGDFYDKQVLITRAGTHFLDFDRAGWADYHADLGLFWAHHERDAISNRIRGGEAAEHLEALLDGYTRFRNIDRRRLALYAAASLFGIAVHPFRAREPEWLDRSVALLARCEKLLEGASTTTIAPGTLEKTTFLAAALDPVRARAEIAAALGPDAATAAPGVLIRHKAGRRALIRYSIGAQGLDGPIAWLGKIRAKGFDQQVYDTYCHLVRRWLRTPAPRDFSLPEPIGVVPSLGMWLQREEAGCPSAAVLAGPKGARAAETIARALSAFHRLNFPSPRSHGVEDEWHILRHRLRRTLGSRLDLRARIEGIASGCERLVAQMKPYTATGIHRDFYPDQVLIDGDRVVLLDFDLCARGDPALDAGNFLAHLDEYALRVPRRADAVGDSGAAFRRAYLARCDDDSIAERIDPYRTLSLARLIDISTTLPERRGTTASLVALCETRLSSSLRAPGQTR